ncbi:Maf1 regulator-domain-containing protein [Clohesyomyces aquaticus]|uniref:Repressor of RNA polymerase III transcription MAF1 n=1 Tax=Clohesyomyces aquaticus TaxID=1231657 RepID=A0A1Y1ZSD5_9PLEO|nr:Maf1 regulator-domain-containing protein [Clohesyomyces aquaticus]
MKFLDLLALNEVNLALTFDTESYTILGNCDAYSTKPARDHKELYARIEKTLEDKYKKMVADLNTLPAQVYQHIAPKMNLERDTPFGTFHERANRRVFAFMIAALNEFHYDYDFANTLNPDHFIRESLEDFKYNIDDTMRHLRPQLYSAGLPAGAMTPLGTPIWSDRSWELIDSEMSLQDCAIYKWKPPVDPFDGEDGSMWSFRYLLYSKEHKRVCYLHLRCVPRSLSYSPTYPESLMDRYKHRVSRESNEDQGSSKRAEYWLGDRAKNGVQYGSSGNLDNRVIDHPYEEVVDREEVVNWLDVENQQGLHEYMSDEMDSDVESLRERDMSRERERSAARERERSVVQERESRKRSIVRSMSEDVADRMELTS